jgi:hypothetical protein
MYNRKFINIVEINKLLSTGISSTSIAANYISGICVKAWSRTLTKDQTGLYSSRPVT